MVAVPESGRSNPISMRIVVDLPAPLGPMNPVNVPEFTSKERSLTTTLSP